MIEKTIAELYDYLCLHYSEKNAITFGEDKYSFSDLEKHGTCLANSLKNLGLKCGDKLAMLFTNCPEILFCDYANSKLGLVRVPLAYYLRVEDMVYMLQETEATAIIYHEIFRDQIDQIRAELPELKQFICLTQDESSLKSHEISLARLIAEGSSDEIPNESHEDDLYIIVFTGGTTGRPKGVLHSHRTIMASITMELLEWGIGRDEVNMAVTPLTHGAGLLVPAVWLRGGSVVVLATFDLAVVLETIEKEKVTTSFLVPTIIYAMLDFPDLKKYDTSSLKNIVYGAAPIAPQRLKEAIQTFGPVFTQLYGQTEGPNALITLSREEHIIEGDDKLVARLASCGRPSPAVQLRLIDDKGEDVPNGEPGQITVKSPNIMLGYLNQPELTAETIKDGWLHTGDVARQDENGYVYIVDRVKDMIVSGGFNIYPKEIEDTLHEHPAVAMAAVIGVPDEKWGEAVKAMIMLKPDMTVSEDELITLCKEKKGSIFAPKSVDFVDIIPTTPLGKPDKKVMRKPFWEGQDRSIG